MKRARIRGELFLAGAAAALGLVTIFWRDWIEIVFGVDPDHGNGSLEWLFVAALLAMSVTLFVLARWERSRLYQSP
jgi:hypothetical protein